MMPQRRVPENLARAASAEDHHFAHKAMATRVNFESAH
jgi:hypothetical protein